jgi:hypothetical protein
MAVGLPAQSVFSHVRDNSTKIWSERPSIGQQLQLHVQIGLAYRNVSSNYAQAVALRQCGSTRTAPVTALATFPLFLPHVRL